MLGALFGNKVNMRRGAVLAICTVLVAAAFSVLACGAAYAAPQLEEYQGNNRFETAAQQTRAAFEGGVESGYAVLVNGEDSGWPDALSASSLAGALSCPVLLSSSSSLPDATASLISDLGIFHVVVVGGSSVVADSVLDSLGSMGVATERVYGNSRQDTQAAVYSYGKAMGAWSSTAFVASGYSYADALSASPIAYSAKMPVFLAAKDGSFTDSQVAALFDGGTLHAVILGGESAVSSSADGFMTAVTMCNAVDSGEGSASGSVERISGELRTDTSLAVAEWAVSNGYASWNNAAFANGWAPADSLSGSSLQGRDGSVLLLVSDENSSTISGLAKHADQVADSVRVFGGTSVMPIEVRDAICKAVGAPYLVYDGHEDYAIMGESTITVNQMVAAYNARKKTYPAEALSAGGAATIEEFCKIVDEEAHAEGVKSEVVFAQAMVETGWLQFGGDVKIEQFNFAGIGATGNGEPGNSFEDVRTGIRAQVQHLKAYASTGSLSQDCVDPRFKLVKRGSGTTVQRLSMKWAMSHTYGDQLVTLIKNVKTY